MDSRICGNGECKKEFTPKVHNGKYCSPECRKIATNKNILEKYHSRKSNKFKQRVCKTKGCGTILSRYNSESICEVCKVKKFNRKYGSI